MEVEISRKKPDFLRENFFHKTLENFLRIRRICCRYLKGCPSVALYNGKKLGTYDTPNAKYGRKRKKNSENHVFQGFLEIEISRKNQFFE